MEVFENPHRGTGPLVETAPFPSTDAAAVARLLEQCPAASEMPLVVLDEAIPGVALWLKDERGRMGLGSFKALGAAYVIACDAVATGAAGSESLAERTYITASAGNHGMSVAAGARVFGANAVVYIAETVPESFAARLAEKGAEVRREGKDYAASMTAAAAAADAGEGILLSDSSWDGYFDIPHRLMEGYLAMAEEAARQVPDVPTHIFLQAGVGGLAGAVAAYARKVWGDAPEIIVVEPDAAPALRASVEAGEAVFADGPDSSMGRLDCKEPSLIALNGLARDADVFLTLSDGEVEARLPDLAAMGVETTPSGGAGAAAALMAEVRSALGIGDGARILCVISEAPE
jgi:diaminopropionate ammonia-lyase